MAFRYALWPFGAVAWTGTFLGHCDRVSTKADGNKSLRLGAEIAALQGGCCSGRLMPGAYSNDMPHRCVRAQLSDAICLQNKRAFIAPRQKNSGPKAAIPST